MIFLDIRFNLNNGMFKPYKKPNDSLLYIKKSSNHPSQLIKQLPKFINNRLSKNSPNEDVFNESKGEYENALKQSGYNNIATQISYGLIHHSTVMSPLMLLKSFCNC